MIDFSGLLTPILLAMSLLTVTTVTDLQTTYFQTITVPDELPKEGYTSDVVARVIRDNMLEIENQAQTRAELRRLRVESETTVLGSLVNYINLGPLVRSFQKSSGLLEYYLSGEVVDLGQQYRMRLRFDRYRSAWRTVEVVGPKSDVEAFLRQAAITILKVTDPQIYCSSLLRGDYSAGSKAYADAQACVGETLPYAAPDDRPWLLNLAGVLAFLRGDAPLAGRWFTAAMAENPDFSPALLNHATLDYVAGRYEDTIVHCRAVFRTPLPSDSPQTYAATYLQWGLALVKLDRYAEAVPLFEKSAAADPKFANIYFQWAKIESDRGNSARAAELEARGKRIADVEQIYVENIMGHVPEMNGDPMGGR